MKKSSLFFASAMALFAATAAELKTVGNWRISFDETTETLSLANDAARVKVEGPVAYKGAAGSDCRVVLPQDAADDRLGVVDLNHWLGYKKDKDDQEKDGMVIAYISFRGWGDRLSLEVFNRGVLGWEKPGSFAFDVRATVRPDSFPCRTVPVKGERVINFADGVGDSALNDSIFAREEDLALRFFSRDTRIASCGGGTYTVHVEAGVVEAAEASVTIEADCAYYASRWAPGYRPINRKRCPRAPTGWMNWNTYFDKAGAKANLAEARVAAEYLKPFGLEIISIESWQGGTEWLPTSDSQVLDHSRHEPQFPYSMKQLADEIRALAFNQGPSFG